MYVSEIYNRHNLIGFRAKLGDIKAVQSGDAVVYLKGELASQVSCLTGAFNSVYNNLRKLALQVENEKAQTLLSDIKIRLGISEIFENRTDGIVFDYGDKRMLLSSHGSTTFRIRQQDVKTGEIEDSILIRDKKIAKTDTKHIVPEKLEFFQHKDVNIDEFEQMIQRRVSSADLALLRLRRQVETPEVLEEIKNAAPIAAAPSVVVKSVVPTIKTSALKKLPSQADYEAIFAAQKAAKAYVESALNSDVKVPEKKSLAERIAEKMSGSTRLVTKSAESKPQVKSELKTKSVKVNKTDRDIAAQKPEDVEVNKKVAVQSVEAKTKTIKETGLEKASKKSVGSIKKVKESKTKIEKGVATNSPKIVNASDVRRGRPTKGAQEAPAGKIQGVTTIFNSIFERYSKFKKVFMNAGVPRRRKILQMAELETKQGYPALIMKNVGCDSEILHVSFPLFDGKKALKINVLDKNEVLRKIFYLEDEQMVRINKDEGLSARLHKDRKKRYLSQEEIDNTDIKMYLGQIDERMERAVNVVDTLKSQKNIRFFSKRSTDAGKDFLGQIQKDLKKFNAEISQRMETSTVDVSSIVRQEFNVLQENTTKAIEEIKQRLLALLANNE